MIGDCCPNVTVSILLNRHILTHLLSTYHPLSYNFLTPCRPPTPLVGTVKQDEKANVRRNAVPALEALLVLSPAFRFGTIDVGTIEGGRRDPAVEHAGDLLLLEERCNDVSLSTRKVRAVTGVLLRRYWFLYEYCV